MASSNLLFGLGLTFGVYFLRTDQIEIAIACFGMALVGLIGLVSGWIT